MSVRRLLALDIARRVVSAKSQCCSSKVAIAVTAVLRACDASSSTTFTSMPALTNKSTPLDGTIVVVSSIGDLLPREGRRLRCMARCTILCTVSHAFTGLFNSLQSGRSMSSVSLLLRSDTACVHFA